MILSIGRTTDSQSAEHVKIESANKKLPRLRATIRVEKEMGETVGRGGLPLLTMPT